MSAATETCWLHDVPLPCSEPGHKPSPWPGPGSTTQPPALTDEEVSQRIAADRQAPESGVAPDLSFRSLAEVAADVDSRPPRRFLFEPVIVAGDYGVMSAAMKVGKSWGVGDAAVSCAAGLPWLGQFPCRSQGAVIVFYGEGSDAKFIRRIRAIAAFKGLSRADADALPIVVCCRAPQLGDQQHQHSIRKALEEHRPALVILDPLYLSAKGGKGSDLYSMGALLGAIQRIAQEAGATLLISHHWNKTGAGNGHDRSSGVGPGEWGRFLISVAALGNKHTNEETKETTVRLKWQFIGDEIADTDMTIVRRVRAEEPTKLNSVLHYSVERVEDDNRKDRSSDLPPADRKLMEAMEDAGEPQTVQQLVDRIIEKHGHGLRRETCSKSLHRLAGLGIADQLPGQKVGKAALWFLVEESAGQTA